MAPLIKTSLKIKGIYIKRKEEEKILVFDVVLGLRVY